MSTAELVFNEDRRMQITCSTTSAAAEVIRILLHAGLRPILDYELSPVLSIVPPIDFTMRCVLTAAQITQIGAIADTTIESKAA
jgi:hypothetical protein